MKKLILAWCMAMLAVPFMLGAMVLSKVKIKTS